MKIRCQITFLIGDDGLVLWKLNRLKVLVSYFRSVVTFRNITARSGCSTDRVLEMMSLRGKPNQLCQLWIDGLDAELACMVLTDFISEHFYMVEASQRSRHQLSELRHPALTLPFDFDYRYIFYADMETRDKGGLLAYLSRVFQFSDRKAMAIFRALDEREAISSTYIHHGIAFPHVMSHLVEIPSLAVVRLSHPVDWQSVRGAVDLVIALFLPASPDMDMIRAVTWLSRSLLDDSFCQALLRTKEAGALQAILYHTLASELS
ncbi:PTS sugar transporter subunit IIA [Vibrio quintilis]|uniref:Putative fructose-like phosphotransferase system subunit EIIA n=1 Tax=Vibrio quintilis TaxID=1117707 RepID=A0A1M7YTA4_9VIBR|nr:PTS sugar transporter subunit IIA [Vibrio quintilis]SHO55870.1 putative fructose-like phosphotransferase system subunit EIIA [Vibrio quintilis]